MPELSQPVTIWNGQHAFPFFTWIVKSGLQENHFLVTENEMKARDNLMQPSELGSK